MSIDKQTILHDLQLKDAVYASAYSSPLMFSRDSSMETLSSFNVNFHSHNSTYTSEHSTNPSGILSPSDIPDSPPRGCDDDLDAAQQRSTLLPLNNTRSTGITVIERTDHDDDDNDVDSVRDYAALPSRIVYDGDEDDDNDSIRSSLSSLTLPPPPSSSSSCTLNDLRKLRHNLSVINEESLHEHNDRPRPSFNISHSATDDDDDEDEDDDDDDDDQKGKRLLFELIRQRLPHHHASLTSTSDSSPKTNDDEYHNESKVASSSMNDQTMRDDGSNHGLSSHDITIPSSAMQESGYDSLLPMGSAPKRSLSNASLSTTRSVTIKKKHRCDEENDDPMNGNGNTGFTDDDDDDDEHYDKKAGEALLRNLIAQVLPSFNPRYLNNDEDDEDDIVSNPRRPSPTSQTYSSSNASSIRSADVEIEMNKKSEQNLGIRSTKRPISSVIQPEKTQTKRSHLHRPVHPTKASELRRLQAHSRR